MSLKTYADEVWPVCLSDYGLAPSLMALLGLLILLAAFLIWIACLRRRPRRRVYLWLFALILCAGLGRFVSIHVQSQAFERASLAAGLDCNS